MGRKPKKTNFPDRWHVLGLRLKGRLKNQIIDYSKQKKVSVNELILYAIWEFIRNEKGIPSPGTPQYSLPTREEAIAAYIKGEQLLMPCGQKECKQILIEIDSLYFCDVCNIRIK